MRLSLVLPLFVMPRITKAAASKMSGLQRVKMPLQAVDPTTVRQTSFPFLFLSIRSDKELSGCQLHHLWLS